MQVTEARLRHRGVSPVNGISQRGRQAPDMQGARSCGAVDRRDDAAGHGAAEAEGIADRDHPVAHARLPRIAVAA